MGKPHATSTVSTLDECNIPQNIVSPRSRRKFEIMSLCTSHALPRPVCLCPYRTTRMLPRVSSEHLVTNNPSNCSHSASVCQTHRRNAYLIPRMLPSGTP
jgi:hypothetical protein